ncbi:TIR domain-containing protein [Hymenobacter sp. B81]|uniref:TIR domain-containing protein n=1 Tax=Hymenobacter sp. B81 TaxID=3344878 RepID=UPI0037DC5C9D
MARRVFFSFHYEDVKSFRVNVVRNSNFFKLKNDASRIIDASLWEKARLKGTANLKELIDTSLVGSSVTAVLIGSATHSRRWVKYELVKSFMKGNAILGIHLNRIRERTTGLITRKGLNPLERLAIYVPDDYRQLTFLELVDGRWQEFALCPTVANRERNTVLFEESWRAWFGRVRDSERIIRFSDLFETYCWIKDDGYYNLADWIEAAHELRICSV